MEALSILTYLRIDRDGGHVLDYTDAKRFLSDEVEYEDGLEEATCDILSNASALAEINGPLTAELTAGADSRLVAAALTRAGVADRFAFYCRGDEVNREQTIAQAVAAHLGLTMTRHPGTRVCVSPSSAAEVSQWVINHSHGIKQVGRHAGYSRSPGLVLNGSNGELLRSFYSGRLAADFPPSATGFLSAVWSPILRDPESGILRAEIVDGIVERARERLAHSRALGIRSDAAADYLYIAGRNRYFISHTTMETSRFTKQFGPLYTLAGTRLALESPLDIRGSGLIMFDMFNRLNRRALQVPFDTSKFGPYVGAKRDLVETISINDIPAPHFDDRRPPRAGTGAWGSLSRR